MNIMKNVSPENGSCFLNGLSVGWKFMFKYTKLNCTDIP